VDIICGSRAMANDMLTRGLHRSMERIIADKKSGLSGTAGRLDALSPLATLSRGYSVCLNQKTGKVIRDSGDINTGDTVCVRLHRGSIKCQVKDTLK